MNSNDIKTVAAAATIVKARKGETVFVTDKPAGENGHARDGYPQAAARFSADRRFAIVTRGRGRYQFVALLPDVLPSEGHRLEPVYRTLPNGYISSSVALAEEQASERFAALALRPTSWTLELPGEAAPKVEQLVALRALVVDRYGKLEHSVGWGQQAQAFTDARRRFLAEYKLDRADTELLGGIVHDRAAALLDQRVWGHGYELSYTTPVPDAAVQVERAHDEAIELVLQARANKLAWTATLQVQALDLEAELRAALEVQLEVQQRELARAQELAVLALHDVREAAARCLETRPGLFGGARAPHRIATELATAARDLETVTSDPVAATHLDPAAVRDIAHV